MAYNADMTISELLTERLADGSTTQDEAALRLGVSQATVNRWKNGKSAPEAKHSPTLAAFLHLSEEEVVRAIHRQKLASPTQRIDALERQVAELTQMVRDLRDLVRERGR